MAWCRNVEAAWPDLQRESSADFQRFWRYVLLSCAGFFRSRHGQLWQVVITQSECRTPYRSWRPGCRISLLSGAISEHHRSSDNCTLETA